MKKAFTMLELLFVIVVIGILVAIIIPNTRTNPLQEAAIQIVSDIRYTQHLAMVDDRYDSNDLSAAGIPIWYRERWQILFSANGGSGGEMGYTIFSDTAGDSTGNPDATEIAQNPSNSSELMTGGINSLDVTLDIDNAGFVGMNKLNIGRSYGINGVVFPNACSINGSTRLTFDHIGRPIRSNLSTNITAYDGNDLIENDCNILLTHATGDTLTIRVHRETGYVCILDALAANCI